MPFVAGCSWYYPNSTYAERRKIYQQHVDYQQGFLWCASIGERGNAFHSVSLRRFADRTAFVFLRRTLANDKAIPKPVQVSQLDYLCDTNDYRIINNDKEKKLIFIYFEHDIPDEVLTEEETRGLSRLVLYLSKKGNGKPAADDC